MPTVRHTDVIAGPPYPGWVQGDDALAPTVLDAEPGGDASRADPGPGTQTGAASNVQGLIRTAEVSTEPRITEPNPRHSNEDGAPNWSPDAGYFTPTTDVMHNTFYPTRPATRMPDGSQVAGPGPETQAYSDLVPPELGTSRRARVKLPRAIRRGRRRRAPR